MKAEIKAALQQKMPVAVAAGTKPDIITCKAQMDGEWMEVKLEIPPVMAKRLVSRAQQRDLSEFLLNEVFRRSVESYVF